MIRLLKSLTFHSFNSLKIHSNNDMVLSRFSGTVCSLNFVKPLCTEEKNTVRDKILSSENNEEEGEYITIYKEPRIAYFSIFNKTARFGTIGAGSAFPVSAILYMTGIINSDKFTAALIIGSCLIFYINFLVYNIWRRVGFLYVNKDINKLKVGYVSYWGKREDVILPVNQVMTFSDMRQSPLDILYRKVKTFDSKWYKLNIYKLDVVNGDIIRPDIFHKIFGSV